MFRPKRHVRGTPNRIVGISLKDQREANQELVLAGIRAHEEVDVAVEAKRRAEEEAIELRVTAELRERLIGIVGHDLRTPLNTMVMAASLLQARAHLADEDARLVNRILLSGRRMTHHLSELVEFTRARVGGGFTLQLGPCDLGEVVDGVVEELRVLTPVPIHCLLQGDLHGTWDADRLAEALSNLTSNACDHADAGTDVVIATHTSETLVTVDVTNQGPAISTALLPHIFEPFRGGRRKEGARGAHLGLGLFVAAEVARAHGGSIHAVSAAGTTTFTLAVPRHTPPRPAVIS
jgi:signal transduction histidine kinase